MPRKGDLRPLKERFWGKLPPESKRDPLKCWEWKGGRFNTGYGAIGAGRRHDGTLYAHRVAWELANDQKIPEGMCVLHHCDNRACCNHHHLYIGTNADNVCDRIARGRTACGEDHYRSKVPDWIIKEALRFLKAGVTYEKVARMLTKKGYPCHKTTVSNWARSKTRGIESQPHTQGIAAG